MDGMHGDGEMEGARGGAERVEVRLEARPERELIRRSGSFRHVDFRIQVGPQAQQERLPLTLALVLDRSGSMSGHKLGTAKQAALAIVNRLNESDQVAVVVFDDRIDVLQPAAPVTAAMRAGLRRALATVEARASTALHEGWLTGCREIAPE